MTRPFQSIPKELARNGRETLLAPVAEAGQDVWCLCKSGHLVRMTPLVPRGSVYGGGPFWDMRHYPSTRSRNEPNLLFNHADLKEYTGQLIKAAKAMALEYDEECKQAGCLVDNPKLKQRYSDTLLELYGFAHSSDLYPPGTQCQALLDTGLLVKQAMHLNLKLSLDRDKTIHDLTHMQPDALGLLMANGLNVRNIQQASNYSMLPDMAKQLEAHFDKHLGEALRMNLETDSGCLVVGGNGMHAMPSQEYLLYLEDFPAEAQNQALQHAGIDPDYYRRAVQTIEMADLSLRSDEGQAELFRLVQSHVQGLDQEVEVEEDFDFASALDDAHFTWQQGKAVEQGRDR